MEILTRERLVALPRRRLDGGRNVTKAVIEVVEHLGRSVVVKDLAPRPWPVRLLLGPIQLDREARAYRALRDLPGVPRFLGRIDRMAIALEFIPGLDLASVRPDELPSSFFDRLELLLDRIHARGVAHGDLGRRDVLVGPGGEPFVVDYSTAIVAGQDADPLTRFLFDQMCLADRRSVAKIRRRLLSRPRDPVPAAPALYRAGSRLKACAAALRRPRAYLQRLRTLLASARSSRARLGAEGSDGTADHGGPHQEPQGHSRRTGPADGDAPERR